MPLAIVDKTPLLKLDTVLTNRRYFPKKVIEPVLMGLQGSLVGSYRGDEVSDTHLTKINEKLRAYDEKHGPPTDTAMQKGTRVTHITNRLWIENRTVFAKLEVFDTYHGRKLCAYMDTFGSECFHIYADLQLKMDTGGAVQYVTGWEPYTVDYFIPQQ